MRPLRPLREPPSSTARTIYITEIFHPKVLRKHKFRLSKSEFRLNLVFLTIFERLFHLKMVQLREVIIILVISLISSNSVNGQFFSTTTKKEDLIQFSGIIRNLEYHSVGHVNIIVLNKNRGSTADSRGIFSFVVHPNDTVLFSHIGYKPTIHVIPDSLGIDQYPSDIFLVSDTFKLAEIKIFPWKTYEQFKEAFIALEMPTDNEQRAMRNIALIKTQIKINDYDATPNMNFREVMQQQYNQLYTEGQYPYYTVFDPMRWAEFFNALKRGDFKNKK